MEDPRKTGLKNGLRQLTPEQIGKVLDYKGEILCDTYNYQDGKFCALAIGLGLDSMENPTNEKVLQVMIDMGYKIANTKGIEGSFYREDRLPDLLEAAREVLLEKLDIQASDG